MNLSTIQKGCVLVTSHFTDKETETLENSAASLLSVSECQYCHWTWVCLILKLPVHWDNPGGWDVEGDGTGVRMYTRGWFMSMYGENHHNTEK